MNTAHIVRNTVRITLTQSRSLSIWSDGFRRFRSPGLVGAVMFAVKRSKHFATQHQLIVTLQNTEEQWIEVNSRCILSCLGQIKRHKVLRYGVRTSVDSWVNAPGIRIASFGILCLGRRVDGCGVESRIQRRVVRHNLMQLVTCGAQRNSVRGRNTGAGLQNTKCIEFQHETHLLPVHLPPSPLCPEC